MVAGLATVATMAASCGTSNAAISGKTPPQILAQALSKLETSKFTFNLSVTFKADLTKVKGFSPAQLGAFGPILASGLTLTADGTYESQARAMVHIKIPSVCTGDIYIASYDGRSYSSTDGKTWADTGAATTGTSKPPTQDETTKALNGVGFTDKSTTTQGGQTVEDIRLDFNNGLITKILQASGGDTSSAASIGQVINITGDGTDIYIQPADGLPEGASGTLNVTVSVDQLVGLLSLLSPSTASALGTTPPSGSLGLSLSDTLTFSNYGSASVPKPATGGTAGDPCASVSSLFAGLASSMPSGVSGGSGAVPTPDLSSLNDFSNSLSSN